MAENRHYGRQIAASLIVTLIVLVALTYVFGTYLIPKYAITQEQLYRFAVRVFPLLIGLVMIEAGVLVAHRKDDEYADQADKLPPNAYDAPLERMPVDDPALVSSQGLSRSQAKVVESSSEAESEDEPSGPAEAVISPSVSVPASEHADMSFPARLDEELESAEDQDYDLTLVLARTSEDLRDKVNEKLAFLASDTAFPFSLEDGTEALVFPFFNKDEAEHCMNGYLDTLKTDLPDAAVTLGYASRAGRMLNGDVLVNEAKA